MRESSDSPGIDPVNIGCNVLFVVLLLIPAGGLVLLALVALASVPLLVALFPTALSLGAIAMLVLYLNHRRHRRARQTGTDDGGTTGNPG